MNRRIALITAGTLATVVVAGTAAVAASLGILDASAADDVGQLSAAAPATGAGETDDSVTFQVADAGRVTVVSTDDRIVVTDVVASDGWTSSTEQPSTDRVVVEFAGPSGALRLTVNLVDGELVPDITEVGGPAALAEPTPPATSVIAGPSAPPVTSSDEHEDDDHEDGEHEEHEDDEHEDEEHEGRDWDD